MLRPWKVEIALDYDCSKAIYLQIADAIIEAIKSGRLKKGEALPSSRTLALLLKVNRNTAVEAIHVLLNEEYIITKERKGTFVSTNIPRAEKSGKTLPENLNISTGEVPSKIHITFDDGHPDSKIAPVKELARAYRQIFNRQARWQMMGYGNELGDPEFRSAIAQMLSHQRAMKVSDENICVTRGSQMATYLAAHLLIEKGDIVLIESPGYGPAYLAFKNAGAEILPVSVDKDGLMVDQVRGYIKAGKRVKAIYTTPHHQFPTTVTLSLQRRLELIALSNLYGFTIVEDDYDNEFHFSYRPILPISSHAEASNYLYIGTMSKVVAPALRIGYLVSSKDRVQQAGLLRKIIDVQGDAIMEQAVLQLIKDGTIRKHLKKATLYYKAKRDYFEKSLNEILGDRISFTKPDGGLAFWIEINSKNNLQNIEKLLVKNGVQVSLSENFAFGEKANGLRLGYASLREDQIDSGIRIIANCL